MVWIHKVPDEQKSTMHILNNLPISFLAHTHTHPDPFSIHVLIHEVVP